MDVFPVTFQKLGLRVTTTISSSVVGVRLPPCTLSDNRSWAWIFSEISSRRLPCFLMSDSV